jgi:hypothetical protein
VSHSDYVLSDAYEAYRKYRDMLFRRRRDHGPNPSEHEFRQLLALRDAAARADPWLDDDEGFPTPAQLALMFGCELPAPVAAHSEGHRRKRTGKSYDAKVVLAVVQHTIDLRGRPSRAVRDQWRAEIPGATTTLIDHVFGLMGGRQLSSARRKRWERETRGMADDGSVTLAELTKRLKPR